MKFLFTDQKKKAKPKLEDHFHQVFISINATISLLLKMETNYYGRWYIMKLINQNILPTLTKL